LFDSAATGWTFATQAISDRFLCRSWINRKQAAVNAMFLQWGIFFDVTTTTHGEGAAKKGARHTKNCHLMRESVTNQQICRICGWQFFRGASL
jgi:hypothetical protein